MRDSNPRSQRETRLELVALDRSANLTLSTKSHSDSDRCSVLVSPALSQQIYHKDD